MGSICFTLDLLPGLSSGDLSASDESGDKSGVPTFLSAGPSRRISLVISARRVGKVPSPELRLSLVVRSESVSLGVDLVLSLIYI